MSDDPAIIGVQDRLYHQTYVSRTAMRVALVSVVMNAVLLVAFVVVLVAKPEARYFIVDSGLKVLEIKDRDRIPLSDRGIRQWTLNAVLSATNVSFSHYRQQFTEAETYFLPDAWSSYFGGLQNTGNFDLIVNKKVNLATVATGAAVIVREEVIDGVHQWLLQVPLAMTYESAAERRNQSAIAKVVVVRSDRDVQQGQLAISQLVIENN